MKKQYLLILMFLFSLGLKAQHCDYNYQFQGGVFNTANFSPNSAFSPNIYHFAWDFGDGTTSTNSHPVHAFNALPPFYVCYDVLDSSNNIVCSFCDSISPANPANCPFTAVQGAGLAVQFSTAAVGASISWTFDNGTTVYTGNPVTYTFGAAGSYNVCMVVQDSIGDTLCTNCHMVNVTGTSGTCSFTYSNVPATPNDIGFVANVGIGSTVSWDFGDGTTGTGIQTNHHYATGGTYNVCITSIAPNGVTCTYCHHVIVGILQGNCYFTYGATSAINTFDFTGHSAWLNNALSWDFGDGTTGTGANITHTYAHTGNYIVCMSETDSTGTIVCSSCHSVVVSPANNCNFTTTLNPFHNLTIDFQANSGPGSTVTWDFGDGTTGTGASASHTYTAAGAYNVCITVASGGTVNCTACRIIQVGNSLPCIISYYPDPANANSYSFTVTASGGSSLVVWDFGDGTIDTGMTVSHTYAAAGSYQVCIVERDFLGTILCQTCVAVVVSGGPVGCQASFLSTSLGLTAYFIDLSIVNSAATTYSWDFGDGTTSNVHFPQHLYATPGTYNACLTISSGACTDQFCSPVIVDTLFNPGGGGCQAFYTIIQLAPYEVTVVNLSSGVNLNFLWDFGDGTTDTQAYPSHFYTSTGDYNLCLTVSDANGCSSSFCDTLHVDSLGNLHRIQAGFTLNVISPESLTGVNEVKAQTSFRAYPNPTSSEIHVTIASSSEKAKGYRILSLQGSEVISGSLDGFEGKISVGQLSVGTYLLEVTLTDGSRSYQSIIKN